MRIADRIVICLVALAAWSLSGCAVISWLVGVSAPPPKVKAQYKPPKGKRILVLVDDILHPVEYGQIKRDLTTKLNRLLTANGVAGDTVEYDRLLDLIIATPNFNQLRVSEIGRKLNADIVLHVRIEEFSLKEHEGSLLWRGRLKTTVAVAEVDSARWLWPEDRADGYPVQAIEKPTEQRSSEAYGVTLAGAMAEEMADRIAKLFYDHRAPAGTEREGVPTN